MQTDGGHDIIRPVCDGRIKILFFLHIDFVNIQREIENCLYIISIVAEMV